MSQPAVPDGYELDTFYHPGRIACPVTGVSAPITLLVPIDKTGWSGVTCDACKMQLGQA